MYPYPPDYLNALKDLIERLFCTGVCATVQVALYYKLVTLILQQKLLQCISTALWWTCGKHYITVPNERSISCSRLKERKKTTVKQNLAH